MGKETYYRFTLRRSHYFMCVYLNMLHIEVNTLCTIWLRHFNRLHDAKMCLFILIIISNFLLLSYIYKIGSSQTIPLNEIFNDLIF